MTATDSNGRVTPRLSAEAGSLVSLVRLLQPCSRPELAKRTHLSKAVIGARLRELVERGLVSEESSGYSTGGRPPTLLHFVKDAGHVVAVTIGHSHLQVAVTNLEAEPRVSAVADIGWLTARDEVLERARTMVEDVVRRSGLSTPEIQAIGVSVEGPVDLQTGSLRSVSPLADPLEVRRFFQDASPWPVVVENDVNVLAIAEGWRGAAQGVADFLFVKLGSGTGCGIVSDGRIFHGADGWAGEVGHIRVPGHDRGCSCGNTGCLVTIASGPGLAQTATEIANEGRSPFLQRLLREQGNLSAEDLGRALRAQDPAAAEAIRHAGSCVGQVMGALVSFSNPSLILIGGGLSEIGDLLLSAIREGVYRWSLPLSARHLSIQAARLGAEAPIVGTAAMAVSSIWGLNAYEPLGR